MSSNFRKLSILLSIIMALCLFAPYGVAAEAEGNETDSVLPVALDTSINSDTQNNMEETTPPAAIYTPAASVSPAEAVTEPQFEVIADEPIPVAPVELPKTGGVPAVIFYGLGGLISSAGIMIRRKIK
jgi:LPXTG-motif cell wall-anchored protein